VFTQVLSLLSTDRVLEKKEEKKKKKKRRKQLSRGGVRHPEQWFVTDMVIRFTMLGLN